MQTASAQQTPRTLFSRHRGDGIRFQRLLTGPPGGVNTYELSIVHIADGYATPRHHHNFDQLRLGLSGAFHYTRDRAIRPGEVLYVPEGTWYGPHRNEGPAEVMLVQYGGNHGSGFLTYEELATGRRRSGRNRAGPQPGRLRGDLGDRQGHPGRIPRAALQRADPDPPGGIRLGGAARRRRRMGKEPGRIR